MDEVLRSFLTTAGRIVYATLSTTDAHRRPRSRIVHPVWEEDGERLVGWVGSRPSRLKRDSLERSPFASCLYWDPAHDVAVADCEARWLPPGERALAWERLSAPAPPMGYDPASIWPDGPEGDDFAAIRLDPWRVQTRGAAAMAAGEPYAVWRRR